MTALTLVTSVASAEDAEGAKAAFRVGAQAFEQGQFKVAMDAFEESYRLAPRTATLFSIGQSHRKQFYIDRQEKDVRAAVLAYREYLKQEPKGRRAGESSSALETLEPIATRMGIDFNATTPTQSPTVTAPPVPEKSRILLAPSAAGATARIDNGPAIPLPNRIEVAAGTHTVVVEAPGYKSESRQVPIAEGEPYSLDVKLTELPGYLSLDSNDGVRVYVDGRETAMTPLLKPIELQPGEHDLSFTENGSEPIAMRVDAERGQKKSIAIDTDDSGQRIGSYVVLSLGGASLGVAAAMTGLAFAKQAVATDIESRAATGQISSVDRDEHDAAIDDRNIYRAVAVGTGVGGAALGVTGLLLFFLDEPRPIAAAGPRETAPKPSDEKKDQDIDMAFAPLLGPGLVGGAVGGRF